MTLSFMLSLSLAIFLGQHLLELATIFFRTSPAQALLIILHKLIEMPLLVAYSSTLILNGKNSFTACIFFGILVICPYLHRFLSSAHSFTSNLDPRLSLLLLLLFPPVFSLRIVSFFLVKDYWDSAKIKADLFMGNWSDIELIGLFLAYSSVVLILIMIVEKRRRTIIRRALGK